MKKSDTGQEVSDYPEGSPVEYRESDLRERPDYLEGLPYQTAGDIMYAVHVLLDIFPTEVHPDELDEVLREIASECRDTELFHRYLHDTLQSRARPIH